LIVNNLQLTSKLTLKMEGNIRWPDNKHWFTKLLISREPVLQANKITDALAQEIIISNELTYLTELEADKENVKSWSSYQKYRKELELAILSMQSRAQD